jgi:DNA-binding transcriptional LysR family regulator
MELRHLRYFVAVAEEENVSRAALRLHVSQPGVSRQVRDLEEETGVVLFERTAKSLRLTKAGAVFLGEARAVLRRADEAVAKARTAAGVFAGEVNIGYAPSLTVQILPPALRKFQETHPRVRVVLHDLSTEEMLSRLAAAKLDVALTVRPSARLLRGLRFEELARYAMRVAVAPRHSLASAGAVGLDQIVGEPLIAYSRKEYPEYHTMIEKLYAPTGRKPVIGGEHDSVTSLIAAVESGRGFALVPECLACMVGTRLTLMPLRQPPAPLVVGAIWRPDGRTSPARDFIAAARAGCAASDRPAAAY